MSHSTPSPLDPNLLAQLPHIFVDRSLGAIQLPGHLRAAGFTLTTLSEHYGPRQGQYVADVEWITLVGQQNWIGFHKDANIRRNMVERQAVIAQGARMFCISNGQITAQDASACYIRNFNAIAAAAQQPGPFIYAVRPNRIQQLL